MDIYLIQDAGGNQQSAISNQQSAMKISRRRSHSPTADFHCALLIMALPAVAGNPA
jgi:hypothetical protein